VQHIYCQNILKRNTYVALIAIHGYKYIALSRSNMRGKHKKIVREQLDRSLERFKPLLLVQPPPKGWIRAIRDALGMTAGQLAMRMGAARQRVTRIEQDELPGRVTLATMRKVAAAMDCAFVYGFVPRDSLSQIARRQAEVVATNRMRRSEHLMKLEMQELSEEETDRAHEELVDDILGHMPRTLWTNTDEI
jgi:predicted DNA-binding mobile mystery protein A